MDTDSAAPPWAERLQDALPLLLGPILMVIADAIWLA
jgi:hypothetical protein